jgi:hypothetical protein
VGLLGLLVLAAFSGAGLVAVVVVHAQLADLVGGRV